MQSFASRKTPGAMDVERMLAEENEVGMMNPDIVVVENNVTGMYKY